MTTLTMWTVYSHPKDYPDHFIARKWLIGSKRDEPEATDEVVARFSLDEVRTALPPGLYCIGRKTGDDPCIVEVWL
jgi:hypothetical protein